MPVYAFNTTTRTLLIFENNEARLLTPREGMDVVAALNDIGGKTPSEIIAQRDKLQAFKDFVHKTLDAMGIPAHIPNGAHEKEGCRIGDRLDFIRAQLKRYEAMVPPDSFCQRGHPLVRYYTEDDKPCPVCAERDRQAIWLESFKAAITAAAEKMRVPTR